jgi:maltooligosyltrehalose synthase
VLEKGEGSKYAKYFDIDWSQGKILVPLLGEDRVIEEEHYCLVPWWTSATKTSYRRFFTINELIGIRIEDPEVLREHHKLIFEFLNQGKVDGIRVDHPDGLLDPATYFQRLRKEHKGLIFVEKILGFGEQLPTSWNVDGTVGYEFAHMLTGLFVKKSGALTKVYESFIGRKQDFKEMLHNNKKSFLQREMQGDLSQLVSLLPTPLRNEALESALLELLSTFPVYRSYIEPEGAPPLCEVELIKGAIRKARKRVPLLQNTFDYLEEIFSTGEHRDFILNFSSSVLPQWPRDLKIFPFTSTTDSSLLMTWGLNQLDMGSHKRSFTLFASLSNRPIPMGSYRHPLTIRSGAWMSG